ncbi:MAG: nicotinamide-nucleotide amidase [Gammaproteobacteria bacterium]|jgi:nicotinamide-nucleotide amidase|nr:nicotinamide-nucleotide amidase [Gammaproteobacteria bacterium]
MDDRALADLARRLGDRLLVRGWMAAAAESCTGGWIAKTLTDVPGSSGWFDRGFVTYTNAAKQDLLGVDGATLAAHGAVSEATVREMAAGALDRSGAQVAVAVSGVAGPTGGTPDKPVGTVWLAWARRDGTTDTRHRRFDGDREAVRRQAVAEAIQGLERLLD